MQLSFSWIITYRLRDALSTPAPLEVAGYVRRQLVVAHKLKVMFLTQKRWNVEFNVVNPIHVLTIRTEMYDRLYMEVHPKHMYLSVTLLITSPFI
jgi:hypothetical protein